jgi:DNA-binding NtrC family response regulator
MRHSPILFVDDNTSLTAVYQLSLGERGFDVKTACNGHDAIDLCDYETTPVAIVDLQMPGMDGIETIAALQERQPQMKTIAVSGHRVIPYFSRLSDLGVRHFLAKPFSFEDLLDSIEELETAELHSS